MEACKINNDPNKDMDKGITLKKNVNYQHSNNMKMVGVAGIGSIVTNYEKTIDLHTFHQIQIQTLET